MAETSWFYPGSGATSDNIPPSSNSALDSTHVRFKIFWSYLGLALCLMRESLDLVRWLKMPMGSLPMMKMQPTVE